MTDAQRKEWIDAATYEQLLARWRNEPVGSPWFQGEIGTYYTETLNAKRAEISDAEHESTSRRIGWARAAEL